MVLCDTRARRVLRPRRVTSVEPEEALVAENLLGAVEAVLVHQLPYEGARGALVLHARLHQVDGVDGGGPGG